MCDYECVFRDEEADQHENKVHDGMPKWWDAYTAEYNFVNNRQI